MKEKDKNDLKFAERRLSFLFLIFLSMSFRLETTFMPSKMSRKRTENLGEIVPRASGVETPGTASICHEALY